MLVAKDKANPAKAADILGLYTATAPIKPTTMLESKLNRIESQRFTSEQRQEL